MELKPKTNEEMLTDEQVTDIMEIEIRETNEEPQICMKREIRKSIWKLITRVKNSMWKKKI